MIIIRRLLLVAAVFCFSACERDRTPDWQKAEKVESSSAEKDPRQPQQEVADTDTPKTVSSRPPRVGNELRFITYNVRNWLVSEQPASNGKNGGKRSKPEEEKAAVISLLKGPVPDVVGLCEIGTAEDLAEIQQRLRDAGVELPHSHYSGGSDPVRHLGLLSRFPIVQTERPQDTEYKIRGKTFSMNRGILDVTVEAGGRRYRFVGAHLKSKREMENADQEEIRQAEARLLRQHVDGIFTRNPQERLVVYGDFNDTRASDSLKIITGTYGQADYLTPLPAEDRSGTSWTHFWDLHDVYARIDFITVSRALKTEADFQSARILDDKGWDKASDHRPVLAIFRAKDSSR